MNGRRDVGQAAGRDVVDDDRERFAARRPILIDGDHLRVQIACDVGRPCSVAPSFWRASKGRGKLGVLGLLVFDFLFEIFDLF